jgi:flagellar biogenesis protein FliO
MDERQISPGGTIGGVAGWIANFLRVPLSKVRGRSAKRMQLVETLTLGGRRQLLLVTCDNRSFLIGAGSDQVGTILPLSPEEDAAPTASSVERPFAMGSNR